MELVFFLNELLLVENNKLYYIPNFEVYHCELVL